MNWHVFRNPKSFPNHWKCILRIQNSVFSPFYPHAPVHLPSWDGLMLTLLQGAARRPPLPTQPHRAAVPCRAVPRSSDGAASWPPRPAPPRPSAVQWSPMESNGVELHLAVYPSNSITGAGRLAGTPVAPPRRAAPGKVAPDAMPMPTGGLPESHVQVEFRQQQQQQQQKLGAPVRLGNEYAFQVERWIVPEGGPVTLCHQL